MVARLSFDLRQFIFLLLFFFFLCAVPFVCVFVLIFSLFFRRRIACGIYYCEYFLVTGISRAIDFDNNNNFGNNNCQSYHKQTRKLSNVKALVFGELKAAKVNFTAFTMLSSQPQPPVCMRPYSRRPQEQLNGSQPITVKLQHQ